MNWFKKIVINWVKEDWDKIRHAHQIETDTVRSSGKLIASHDDSSPSGDPILNFKIYNAVGGKVVEFRQYDRKTDRSNCQTYIITNDQDFGNSISKIATLEMMKQ